MPKKEPHPDSKHWKILSLEISGIQPTPFCYLLYILNGSLLSCKPHSCSTNTQQIQHAVISGSFMYEIKALDHRLRDSVFVLSCLFAGREYFLLWTSYYRQVEKELLLIKPKSHLNQKYDQEVKVRDSSELLKQVLGNEVPGGVLSIRNRVTAKLLCRHEDKQQQQQKKRSERKKRKQHNNITVRLPRKTAIKSLTKTRKVKCDILKKTQPQRGLHGCLSIKRMNSTMAKSVTAVAHGLRLAHLGGHNAVVGITLRDVRLGSWRGFFMPDIHRPTVHPVLLPNTLQEKATTYSTDKNSNERYRQETGLNHLQFTTFLLLFAI